MGLDADFLDEWSGRWLAAWNGQEVEAILAICAEDVEIDDPALPAAVHGKAGMRAFATATWATFPDLRLEPIEPPCPSRQGEGAWFPYRMHGTMSGHWPALDIAPTGAVLDFQGVTEWRFRDGLLTRWDTIYDNLAVARQMGIVPAQGSRPDRLFTRLQHLQARRQRRTSVQAP